MSDLDLSAAVEAAGPILKHHLHGHPSNGSEADHWRAAARAVLSAAAPLIAAQVAEQTETLVQALQALCDDEWLRRRDRIMRLPGARYLRDSGAGEIEQAAAVVRGLIEGLSGYDPTGTGGAYLRWLRAGRDEVTS